MDVRRAALVLVLISLVACGLCLPVFAEESFEADRVVEGLDGVLSGVESGGGLADELGGDSIEAWGDSLADATRPERILEALTATVRSALPDALSFLGVVGGVVIIGAVCRRLNDGLSTGALGTGIDFLSGTAVVAVMLGTQTGHFDIVRECFESLCALVEGMIPVTAMVWAMGGNVTTASVGTVTLYSILAVIQRLCAQTVIPVCCVAGVAAVCSSVSDGGVLCGFAGAVKRSYNFFMGVLMTVLVFALGAQTSITVSADTLAARGAKLLTSSVIPVVGGAVGDTLRVVAGSAQYVKSVVGIGGIIMVGALILPTLVSLLLYRLVFLLGAGFADMLGCNREGRLLSEMGNIYGCLVGAVSICSVAFVVSLAIFVRCSVAAS